MFQVTILYQGDCEIGYGEGATLASAKEEARESVSDIYRENTCASDISYSIIES